MTLVTLPGSVVWQGWGMSDTTHVTVERTIEAPVDAIFDVLTNPERHRELDAAGFIRGVDHADRIAEVGDVFTMNMQGDHMGGEYQTDNHVSGYAKDKLVAWKTAPAGTEPPGWEWLWELESQGPGETLVRHTYDWSKVTDKKLLEQVGFPLVTEAQLEETLGRLAAAATA
ncbi:Activator of Hsp90 ATPase homolog 1-like protein [Williamsia deligens]|nr:Activator of Hsp90 ATPase homolog 1-like protein [Williamsia deligens]